MQKITISLAILIGIINQGSAQDKKEKGIYFGALAGTKINEFKRQFAVNTDPRLYSFSIGAGAAWTSNNYVVGFDFIYSNGQNSNNAGEIQYVGFSNTLSFGYNISEGKTWKVEPNVGVVLNNNQLIIQNKNNVSFQNLINNQVCGNIGINIKAVGNNGLFTGLKAGYMLPFSGDTEWENKVTGTATGLMDNVGAFYIQLNLGGFLILTK
jgi:hypothetical protein